MGQCSDWFDLKFMLENGGDLVALTSVIFISIKVFVEYMSATNYAEYYKFSIKNFGIRDLKSFIGRAVFFASICALPILMVYISLIFSEAFSLNQDNTTRLTIMLILFTSILIYIMTLKELCPENKVLSKISTVLRNIIVSFIPALIISRLVKTETFFKVPLLINIILHEICGLYLSFRNQKFKPRKINDYETYKNLSESNDSLQDKAEYVVIQDYGEKVLSVKVYEGEKSKSDESNEDILNLDLDNYYFEDKTNKEFTYKEYKIVYRWKDGSNLDIDKNKKQKKEANDNKFFKIKDWLQKEIKFICQELSKRLGCKKENNNAEINKEGSDK